MSSIYDDVRIALDNILKAISDSESIDVAWENAKFDIDPEEYFSQFLLNVETGAGSLGDIGLDQITGVYQISANVKTGNSAKRLGELCDFISDGFRIRQTVSYGSVDLRITSNIRNPTTSNEKHYTASIDVLFESFPQQRT